MEKQKWSAFCGGGVKKEEMWQCVKMKNQDSIFP